LPGDAAAVGAVAGFGASPDLTGLDCEGTQGVGERRRVPSVVGSWPPGGGPGPQRRGPRPVLAGLENVEDVVEQPAARSLGQDDFASRRAGEGAGVDAALAGSGAQGTGGAG